MTRDDADNADSRETEPCDDGERVARNAAFERLEREQARRMAAQPLWVKLEWLEQAHRRVLQLAGQTARPWLPTRSDDGGTRDDADDAG